MAAPIDLRAILTASLAAPREEDQGRDPEPSSAGVGRGLDGGSRTDVRIGGVVLQIIRDSAALQRPRTGRAGRWESSFHRRAPEVVQAGPVPAVDGVLAAQSHHTFAISLTVGRELKALLGFKISAAPGVQASWPSRQACRTGVDPKRDRAVGKMKPASAMKNKLTRRWACHVVLGRPRQAHRMGISSICPSQSESALRRCEPHCRWSTSSRAVAIACNPGDRLSC